MKAHTRPGRRTAAIAGALAIAGVSATALIAGTASAAGTATCTESVNVRSEPSATAPIVGVCESGQTTTAGQTQDGFVELEEFGGWASSQYVESGSAGTSTSPNQAEEGEDGVTSPSTESPSATSPSEGTNPERSGTSPESSDSTAPGTSDSTAPESSDSTAPGDSDSTAPEGSDSSSPSVPGLGG